MTSRTMIAVAALALSATRSAQTRPDFNGTWDPKPSGSSRPSGASAPSGGMASVTTGLGAHAAWVVTQTPQILSVTLDFGDGSSQKWTYHLDGSESANTNARTTLTTTSHWDNDKLVTEGKQVTVVEDAKVVGTFKETRWLDKDGFMHVETTRAIGGNPAATNLLVFQRRPK